MDFSLTKVQQAHIDDAREFARRELLANAGKSETADTPLAREFDAEQFLASWKACARSRYAGGMSLVDSMLIFEAMAFEGADPGFLFSLGVHQFAVGISILDAGTSAQHERWLPAMANGSTIGALAISEREAGSDSYAMAARAVDAPNGFTLSGEKVWISNAPVADLILVCARSDALPGAFGISCFIVPSSSNGLDVPFAPKKAGLKGAPWGNVVMDGVEVGASSMLGGRGGGAAVFQHSMRWERCGLFAIAVGAMRKNFDDCLAHVRRREQFGSSLIDLDVVARTIGLMKSRIECARLLLYKAASTVDNNDPDDTLVSLGKANVSEAAIANALDAQELYGALGVLDGSAPSQFLNDMLPFRILSGPNDLQYKIASRLLVQGTG